MGNSNAQEKDVQDINDKISVYTKEFEKQYKSIESKSDILTNILNDYANNNQEIELTQLYFAASQLIKNLTAPLIENQDEYAKRNTEAYENVVKIIMPALSKQAKESNDPSSVEFRNLMLTSAAIIDHICFRIIMSSIDHKKEEDINNVRK